LWTGGRGSRGGGGRGSLDYLHLGEEEEEAEEAEEANKGRPWFYEGKGGAGSGIPDPGGQKLIGLSIDGPEYTSVSMLFIFFYPVVPTVDEHRDRGNDVCHFFSFFLFFFFSFGAIHLNCRCWAG
jgi:hypothetical protein